jgi:Helicase C-terminal domain/Type III restriction enzyme, res subunit
VYVDFVIRGKPTSAPDSPEVLFRELRPRDVNVRDLLLRQGDALRAYHHLNPKPRDVAIELPTGAGKTLVGLLIAEWRRRALRQRVAYLCPNVQLVHQAAAKASLYGIDAVTLTGSHKAWDPAALNRFTRGQALAIATYSQVFNSHPKLNAAQTLVLDDAHAGEDPVASTWSILARRADGALYRDLLATVIESLPDFFAERLRDSGLDPYHHYDVELVAPPVVAAKSAQIDEVINAHAADDARFASLAIGSGLERCLMYVSWTEILLRPLIPPTSAHPAFADADQRVYMSATLGSNGELERAFGVPEIARIQVPAGTDEGGFGRRFFVFPGASHPPAVADGIIRQAISETTRTVVLAPSFAELESFSQSCLPEGTNALSARDVESDLSTFTTNPHAALLLANRYDGIDLPDEACRLVVLTGLPANSHLQERFLLEVLGARRVLSERIRTRLVQGAGRATRSARDFAAILVRGDRLTDFCSREDELRAMPPQVQAETRFGLDNSEDPEVDPLILLREFWGQTDKWLPAEAHLTAETQQSTHYEPPGSDALGAAVELEVKCCQALWANDLERAVQLAQEVTDRLSGGEELRPYRALWFYLAAAWAHGLAQPGDAQHAALSKTLFAEAVACARTSGWRPPNFGDDPIDPEEPEQRPSERSTSAARLMRKLGIRGNKFSIRLAETEQLLASNKSTDFERGLLQLGEFLGFEAQRPPGDANPDGVWRDHEQVWIIFEAKTEQSPSIPLSADRIRQATTHKQWITNDIDWPNPTESLTVIVSPGATVDPAAAKVAPSEMALVSPQTIQNIASRCFAALSEVRAKARGFTDEQLAAELDERFTRFALDNQALLTELGAQRISQAQK